jgi:thiamine biosynthesis protein ThiC
MTQLQAARNGIVTPEMIRVAIRDDATPAAGFLPGA